MMIDCKLEQVTELRERLLSIGATSDGDKVQTSGAKDTFADTIAKIVDLENIINRDLDRLIDNKAKARDMIEKLDDEVFKVILYKRYFDRKSFEQIAVECNYSWRWIHDLHSNALIALEKVWEN